MVLKEALENFFIKWFVGPKNDPGVRREIARTIGAREKEKPDFSRNNIVDWVLALPIIKEYYESENLYLSTAFYDHDEKLLGYHYLYFDFDNEERPDLAIMKGLEFARSIKERYGAEPITYLSGRKGLGVLVIVKDYIDWETYQTLWRVLIQPYSYLSLLKDVNNRKVQIIDTKILDKRRVHRIPFTYNIKPKHKRLSALVDLNGKPIKPEDFDWSLYQPLNPGEVTIYRIRVEPVFKEFVVYPRLDARKKKPLPATIEELMNCDVVPPCMRNLINAFVSAGDIDHTQRVALVLYLKWVGFGVEDVVEFFRQHAKDFNERITKYQVEYLYGLIGKRVDWLMYSCGKLKEVNICLNCGWGRNPVTYTYAKAEVPKDLKERFFKLVRNGGQVKSLNASTASVSSSCLDDAYFRLVLDFVGETGLREFSYGDLKEWLEGRQAVTADYWHSIERKLRELASSGCLGRKYLVNGVWVDYGSGPIEGPPSKEVRFYLM